MATSVFVLAPNGRRQTVKCTANTTILQIIEEVCHKQGFKPEDYDIKHHNKVLDTTISVRFSGLPNNAQLELATATKARVDSEVMLALSLEDGSRVTGNFLPDDTLANVLIKLCPNGIDYSQNPIVIYMRNEVYGEKLQVTSLRSLGLRGGRAMLRLVYRHPEELKTQANVSAPLPVKPVEEKPYHRVLKTEDNRKASLQKTTELDFIQLARDREKRKLDTPTKFPESEAPVPSPRIKQKTVEPMEVDIKNPDPVFDEENFVFLGERQAMLFSLESARSVPTEDLPDDFFELTIDDAKRILSDIKRKRHEMDNSNLMTAAMRDLEESKKQLRQLRRYKQSVVRVQFADQAILQGSFKPSESINDVKKFVKIYLENENVDFYLYTTPPKSVLNGNTSLLESGCVPGALLHIGSSMENANISLKTELNDKFTTNSIASLAASKFRSQNMREVESEVQEIDSMESVNQAGPSSQPTSFERKVVESTEKAPKWFKPMK